MTDRMTVRRLVKFLWNPGEEGRAVGWRYFKLSNNPWKRRRQKREERCDREGHQWRNFWGKDDPGELYVDVCKRCGLCRFERE